MSALVHELGQLDGDDRGEGHGGCHGQALSIIIRPLFRDDTPIHWPLRLAS